MTLASMPDFTPSKGDVSEDVSVTGNISNDNAVRMSVSHEGASHIMSVLTNLYSNPNLAVLREYSSNALDSHKEAGQTKPIEITLPSSINPQFIVRDFGVGMSRHTIETIYSVFGASTKRNDFTQVGAFGLGCKAALTLSQQFTLTSVKDGVRCVVVISRDSDGVGAVNVISEKPTTDADGVTVTIPISDPYQFNYGVEDFFYTWEKGSVLVNGEEPTSIRDGSERISPSGLFYLNRGSRSVSGLRVITGGIAYTVSTREAGFPDRYSNGKDGLFTEALEYMAIVADIPIGAIDLTPSREAIRYSDRTKKFLRSLFKEICTEIPLIIAEDFSDSKSRTEVLAASAQWGRVFSLFSAGKNKIMWNGEEVPDSVKAENTVEHTVYARYVYSSGTRVPRAEHVERIREHQMRVYYKEPHKIFYIVAASEEEEKKIKTNTLGFIQNKRVELGFDDVSVLSFKAAPKSKWITENDLFVSVTLAEIVEQGRLYRKAKREAGTPTPAKKIYSYDVFTPGSKGVESTVKSTDHPAIPKNAFVVSLSTDSMAANLTARGYSAKRTHDRYTAVYDALGIDKTRPIVIVPSGWKVDALAKRLGYTPEEFNAYCKKQFDAQLASLPSDVLGYLGLTRTGMSSSYMLRQIATLKFLSPKIDDKFLNDTITLCDSAIAVAETYESVLQVIRPISAGDVMDINTADERIRKISRKYPLLNLSDHGTDWKKISDHVVVYINAVNNLEGTS